MTVSLVMLAKVVRVGRILTLTGVPNIVGMHLLVWIFLDSEVGVTGKEEAVNW